MTREDVISIAQEAVIDFPNQNPFDFSLCCIETIERFAELVAAAEREACAKVCEEKQQYAMPIPCPDGIDGCSVMHCVPARREKTGQECAAAIRARGEK